MRIAMLAPITRRILPRPYGSEEQLISDLCEGLVERGHRVTLFASANSLTRAELVSVCPRALFEWEEDPWPDPRWWEEMHIAECMARAARGDFDLIHNHMHAKALPYAALLSIPFLTTLHGLARDRQLHPMLRRFSDYPFVVADEAEEDLLPGLNYAARIGYPSPEQSRSIPDMVDGYEELYRKLVSGQAANPVSETRRLTPWGSWQVLRIEPNFKVKRIAIVPGQRLSYQRHRRRREHWVVTMGEAEATLDGKVVRLLPGEAVDIPVGVAHRIGNPGAAEMVFIEVQRGDYFGEDDLERLEDDYGRK